MTTTPILLVEDNSDDVLFMQRAARRAEIVNPITVAPHGIAAIDYLSGNSQFADRSKHPLPCLVLLDLKLPYKSGLEVLEWIRSEKSLKKLPVVMLTTSAENADVERAYELGTNGYLVKPSNMNNLVGILGSIKAFWIDHNVPPAICGNHSAKHAKETNTAYRFV